MILLDEETYDLLGHALYCRVALYLLYDGDFTEQEIAS